MKLAILNAAIVTISGSYTYSRISLRAAKKLVRDNEIVSYCGHESTSALMSRLLGIDIPVSRKSLKQRTGQKALVFCLKERAPEGIVYTEKDLKKIGFEFGVLERTK